MYFFTSDEHFFHKNILDYCKRPFSCLDEMHKTIIDNFNRTVQKDDITVHAGDFSFGNKKQTKEIIKQLNGSHIFLRGCHDRWLSQSAKYIYQKTFGEDLIVVCHYCMRTWKKSHYNSIHLHGHSHGRLKPIGKSMDIGVDNHYYYPFSIYEIKGIMANKPDNFNFVQR